MTLKMTEEQRFWSKVDKTGNCWLWIGGVGSGRYGSFRVSGGRKGSRAVWAHRWSFERAVGPIAAGMAIVARCGRSLCVNPQHLAQVTAEEVQEASRRNRPAAKGSVGKNGYRYMRGKLQHRLVMEKALARPLRRDEHVHHKNGNKLDNRPENLEVYSGADHIRHHWMEAKRSGRCHPANSADAIARRVATRKGRARA